MILCPGIHSDHDSQSWNRGYYIGDRVRHQVSQTEYSKRVEQRPSRSGSPPATRWLRQMLTLLSRGNGHGSRDFVRPDEQPEDLHILKDAVPHDQHWQAYVERKKA